MSITRRTFTKTAIAATSLSATRLEAEPQPELPLELYDPRAPLTAAYLVTRLTITSPRAARNLVERLWLSYTGNRSILHGEWACMYCLNWWRTTPVGKARVRVALIGKRMAQKIADEFKQDMIGPFWVAVFLGAEAISRGILNAVQNVPEFQKNLAIAEEANPEYIFGSPILLQAKMFIKLPPFPISIGDMNKGLAYLEKARPLAEGKMAIWYIFRAEALYMKAGKDACYEVLDKITTEVRPNNNAAAFVYEMTIADAMSMRHAIETGNYNKYTWDPMLTTLDLSKADIPQNLLHLKN